MKRAHFDPVLERRKVLRQNDAVSGLKDAVQNLSASVETVLSSMADLSGCSQLTKDIFLVVALGGINGANKLAISTSTVPQQFTNRTSYVKEIVEEFGKNEWNTAQIEYLVALLDSNYIVSREDCIPQLRKVSEATAVVHTAFLAPPVSVCLIPECKGASLSRPHPPTVATIFTLNNGLLPALKCCLRCNKCGTIYNYSMYGKKKQDGERFYDKQREYVEISDVAFCERSLFSFYCLLR